MRSAATQKALDAYIEASYKAGKVCGVVYSGEGSRLTICISAKNVHLGNFWSVHSLHCTPLWLWRAASPHPLRCSCVCAALRCVGLAVGAVAMAWT
jgi:hypothetical protein